MGTIANTASLVGLGLLSVAPRARARTKRSPAERFIGRGLLSACVLGVGTIWASPAAANPNYISATGSWNQDDTGGTPLADAYTNYCYLTGVTGRYAGDGEQIRVYRDGGSTWYIGGSSQQTGVSGTAMCLGFGAITPEPNGGYWFGGAFSTNTGPLNCQSGWPVSFPCVSFLAQTNTWQGDSVTLLSGITGEFNGDGETVQVLQAGNPATASQLQAGAGSANGVGAWAESLFVGVPSSGFVPAFYGPGGWPASANEAGVYSATCAAGQPTDTTWMAPTSQAFCFLEGIGGAFFGTGEFVRIVAQTTGGTEYWTLEVGSQQAQGTFATARCYALDQSHSQL